MNRRGVFHSSERADTFSDEKVASPQKWRMAPAGQHIELGIAEHNLFLLLGQLGLADKFWGERLLPIGTVYDPFINRGLDALIYACYQGARFMIVATPSGITLAPEGGAHQSINTPLIGMAQDGLHYFEPAYADELAAIMAHGFAHMQAKDGGSIYLRLSTRQLEQPTREMTPELGARGGRGRLLAAAAGGEHPAGHRLLRRGRARGDGGGASPGGAPAQRRPPRRHLARPAACRLDRRAPRPSEGDRAASSHADRLLGALPAGAGLVTVIDGHPGDLSWMGAGAPRHPPAGRRAVRPVRRPARPLPPARPRRRRHHPRRPRGAGVRLGLADRARRRFAQRRRARR